MTLTNIRRLCKRMGLDDPAEATGGWLVLSCPFAPHTHAKGRDRNPSFRIRVNQEGRSGFHCFSCHEHGNLTDLVLRVTALNGRQDGALAAWADSLEMEVDFEDFETGVARHAVSAEALDADVLFALYPEAWAQQSARDYLRRRGVTKEAADIMRLRYDRTKGRVLFPVCDRAGTLRGFVGRSIYPQAEVSHYTYPPLQKSQHLLGAEGMRKGMRDVVVVEGQFAFAHLISIGALDHFDVVATMGSTMSAAQASMLIDHGAIVHLLYDDDAAGNQGIWGKWDADKAQYAGGGACDMLRDEVAVTVPDYPEGVCDPDNLTLDELISAVKSANLL